MNDKPENPPAFPRDGANWASFNNGMTLRDWFAGQVLAGDMLRHVRRRGKSGPQVIEDAAHCAYQVADAMLAVRQVSAP